MQPNNLIFDEQELADEAIARAIRRAQDNGQLPLSTGTNRPLERPKEGWHLSGLARLLRNAPYRAEPELPGQPERNREWQDELKALIKREEGDETFAYHGALSSFRKKQGFRVKPGHGSKEEVSIGYGFNMNRPGARETFKAVLGASDKDFDDAFNGLRGLSQAEKEALLDHDIKTLDGWLAKVTNGFPFRAHQRVALLSLAYNAPSALVKSGILEAAAKGDDHKAAELIRNFRVVTPAHKTRRKLEALKFLGADIPIK